MNLLKKKIFAKKKISIKNFIVKGKPIIVKTESIIIKLNLGDIFYKPDIFESCLELYLL